MKTLIRVARHPFSAAVLRREPEAQPQWRELRTPTDCWCVVRRPRGHDELCQRRREGDR